MVTIGHVGGFADVHTGEGDRYLADVHRLVQEHRVGRRSPALSSSERLSAALRNGISHSRSHLSARADHIHRPKRWEAALVLRSSRTAQGNVDLREKEPNETTNDVRAIDWEPHMDWDDVGSGPH